jgi:hypothetical protein
LILDNSGYIDKDMQFNRSQLYPSLVLELSKEIKDQGGDIISWLSSKYQKFDDNQDSILRINLKPPPQEMNILAYY